MKQLFTILCVCILFYSAHAQEMLGIANSNYAGTNGLSLNPSSMVDSRLNLDINLITLGLSADNDYLFYPKSSLKFMGFNNLVDLTENRGYNDKFEFSKKGNLYNASIFALVRGPSATFHINKEWFAVQLNIRGGVSVSDVVAPVAKFGYEEDGLHYKALHGETFNVPEFKIGAMLWREIGISYGRELMNQEKNYLKGAVTIKRLGGYGSGYAHNTGMSFRVEDSVINYNSANVTYGHSFDEYVEGSSQSQLINGTGWGFDLGFTYEYRPDYEKTRYEMDGIKIEDPQENHYKLRVGVSLIDLGKITFDHDAQAFDIRGRSAAWYGWDTLNTFNTVDFDTTISNFFFGNPYDSRVANKYDMAMPHALSMQVDYSLGKKFYANATWIQRLTTNKPQLVANNILSITPRYERNWIEISTPLSLYQYSQFRAGVALRIASFVIGSDKIGSLLGLSNLGGMDVYTSLKFNIGRTRIKDSDYDGVSDKMDKCPNSKGSWETLGCPDRDGDGIVDNLDSCPDVKGLAQFHGCPDTDGDGIPDQSDECPTIAGLAQFNGCPDTDGDEIPDRLDSCPDVKGLAQFNGCPDTDGDGIIDRLDSCPNVKGLAQFHGCPDTDGDGIIDRLDSCPLVAGPVSNHGCPVVEKVVVKPTAPVKVELNSEEQEIINKVFSNLEFETGKWVIRQSSYEALDGLSNLLKKKPNFKLLIDGHTDNVGSASSNLQLSRNRAESVKSYLNNKGIDPSRITAKGYGLTKPIAANTTPEGRQKNRRVEFTIVE